MTPASHKYRLGSSRRISEIFRTGLRVRDRCGAMVALPNDLGYSRIAYAVGRRSHGNAVRRNRVRRLCREGFRRVREGLPGGLDLVYLPVGGDCNSVEIFAASIDKLAGRLAGRLLGAEGPAEGT